MSEAAEGQDQGAPPGSGSQKGDGGWKPPSDGSWLPKVRVDEMVSEAKGAAARAAEEAARLRAENEALKASKAPAAAETKPLSRTELNALVADGKITQDAADAYWEKSVFERATAEARKEAASAVTQQQREQVVVRQLEEYRGLVPAAWEVGSKERTQVAKEYKSLVDLGFPETKATEVAALRAVFGDPEVIRASRSTGKPGPGESHVETGGARPDAGAEKADAGEIPKGVTPKQKAYYQKQIDKGFYKDWKEVSEELKFATKRA